MLVIAGKHNNKNRVGVRPYNNNNYPERVFSEKKPIHIFGEKEDPSSVSLFLRLHSNNNNGRFLWISLHTDRTVNRRRRTCGTRECRLLRHQKQIGPYTPSRVPFTHATSILYTRQTGFFFCPFQTTRRGVVRGRRGLAFFLNFWPRWSFLYSPDRPTTMAFADWRLRERSLINRVRPGYRPTLCFGLLQFNKYNCTTHTTSPINTQNLK